MAYQDSMTAPIGCDHDDEAVGQEEEDDDDSDPPITPKEHEVVL